MLAAKLLSGSGSSAAAVTYVDDVFSAYTYTGNGSTQNIVNGIDLAGKGGMVWLKDRARASTSHEILDTVRGANKWLKSNTADAEATLSTIVTAFNSNGFSLGAGDNAQYYSESGISWTFRKAPKFFDVVTWTGDSTGGRTVSHSLGAAPGMMIVKRTDGAAAWYVYHRSLGNTKYLALNTTAAEAASPNVWWNTDPTASVFTLGPDVNAGSGTYVAYLFAHDTSADGIIQCGSFTTDGSGNATVTLGWEPQYVLIKRSSGAQNWYVVDAQRGLTAANSDEAVLVPNTSDAETANYSYMTPTAMGFVTKGGTGQGWTASATFVYMAIRRPNKPPTLGTQVLAIQQETPPGSSHVIAGNSGFPVDSLITKVLSGGETYTYARLTPSEYIAMSAASAAGAFGYGFSRMSGVVAPWDAGSTISYAFKRAPGVFEMVCDTGTGSAHTVTHNLGVAPEMVIRKSRGGATQWEVWHSALANTEKLVMNSTAAKATDTTAWNSTSPTPTVFTVGTGAAVNTNTSTHTTRLFATKAGISKVGSYTGNGSSQTIDCGFTTGARFVLIKRTDSTGDWYVWDTARGIIAGNDPHLSSNTASGQVSTDDSIDPDTSGFIVNQLAATNINVSAASYIFLSFS